MTTSRLRWIFLTIGLLAFLAVLALITDLPHLLYDESGRGILRLLLQVVVLLLISIMLLLGWYMARTGNFSQDQMEFMYKMTHELQAPIASIHLASDMLSAPSVAESPERSKKYLRIVKEEVKRMQWHIDNVLHIARAKNHNFLLKLEKTQIDDLIISLLERYEGNVGVELNARNALVHLDRQHFLNVIHNLIDNAFKYTPSDPKVTISTLHTGHQIIISVKDNGIGIAKEEQKKIFENFYRIPENSANVKGFGLGLSYVQQIARAHHWDIQVTSQVGQGSDFRLIIPTDTLSQ
jgi:two-component system, OmpR family, phosphate regulon sensor histidine kinase PhoR